MFTNPQKQSLMGAFAAGFLGSVMAKLPVVGAFVGRYGALGTGVVFYALGQWVPGMKATLQNMAVGAGCLYLGQLGQRSVSGQNFVEEVVPLAEVSDAPNEAPLMGDVVALPLALR